MSLVSRGGREGQKNSLKASLKSITNWDQHFLRLVTKKVLLHNKINHLKSKNENYSIFRYISLAENKYIRYFAGHTKKVVTLCMNPSDDTFLSGITVFITSGYAVLFRGT